MKKAMTDFTVNGPTCPTSPKRKETIQLAHGGGGKLTRQLIDEIFRPAFENSELETDHDSAILEFDGGSLAMTTDSYVVQPLIFPGGDIGSLAVNGTVNDLAMSGARPLYLSAGFILEEGLPLETLQTVVNSMQEAARQAEVKIVTGDTKVVPKGKCDGIFINTAGVGRREHSFNIHPASVRSGDVVLLSGDIGRHGMAVMAAREGLGFENPIKSDCAPVSRLALKLLDAGIELHCLRDLTRGGLATALVEIAQTASLSIRVEEKAIPVRENVQGACEILGFDPLYVANEGRFVAFLSAGGADRALEMMRDDPLGKEARVIGRVEQSPEKSVVLTTRIGSTRLLDLLSGEQLPRIC